MNDDFLALDAALREFIEDDEHVALVLASSHSDLAVPAKLLEAQGRQGDQHVFMLAVNACPAVGEWMNGVASLVQNQIEAANGLRQQEQLSAWPPLPLLCLDPRYPAAQRFRALAEHCASVVPEPARIVWVLLPHECDDRAGYAAFCESLCSTAPWAERHRFILWDDREKPALVPALASQNNQAAAVTELDFSAPRQLDALVQSATDEARPTAQRMDALFQLAAVDFAYKRYGDALEKYGALFGYYEGKDRVRQALCLRGAGDVALQVGRSDVALDRYRSALAIAVELASAALLLPLCLGAGKACAALDLLADAEGYFSHANALAGKLFDPYSKADALELCATVQWKQRKSVDAAKRWESCREVCRRFAYEHRWHESLEAQATLYEAAGLQRDALSLRAQLAGGFARASGQGKVEAPARRVSA